MTEYVIKLGRTKTIIASTLVSILFSVIITLLIIFSLGIAGIKLKVAVGLLIAVTAPLIAAPCISWFAIGLIFKIHKLEEKMRLLATYDYLTGVLSRRAFMEQSNYICRFAERQGLEFTLLAIDLDHFKKINDQYGHAAGDRVLKSFGKIMRQISRESDLAGRIGGEEFALFLPATNAEKATAFAERLHQAVRETIVKGNGAPITFTASIGLAYFPKTVNIEKALSMADKALYSAKKNGRNQTVIYDAELEN
ncbi:MAG: GGDEF domain-containing protein [Spirochaetes bacterium]|nr:GGDEF domain-containing protein [Spirochaetota bacterium]